MTQANRAVAEGPRNDTIALKVSDAERRDLALVASVRGVKAPATLLRSMSMAEVVAEAQRIRELATAA